MRPDKAILYFDCKSRIVYFGEVVPIDDWVSDPGFRSVLVGWRTFLHHVYYVYCFCLGGKLPLTPGVWSAPLVFGI